MALTLDLYENLHFKNAPPAVLMQTLGEEMILHGKGIKMNTTFSAGCSNASQICSAKVEGKARRAQDWCAMCRKIKSTQICSYCTAFVCIKGECWVHHKEGMAAKTKYEGCKRLKPESN